MGKILSFWKATRRSQVLKYTLKSRFFTTSVSSPTFHFQFSVKMDLDLKCGNVTSSISCNCSCNSAIDDSEAGDFECNICFDLAQDPVVTLCGHLYCWPCLYQWLDVHYYSHECPVCKAIIEKERLVPIFGRGRGSSKPRPQLTIEVSVPKRPVGQRPPTAPPASIPYFREAPEPTGSARFGNITLSAFLGILPVIFSLPGNGSYDDNTYGSTSGIPYLFPSSLDGGYAHGFYNRWGRIAEKRFFMRMLFLFLGILALVHLLF